MTKSGISEVDLQALANELVGTDGDVSVYLNGLELGHFDAADVESDLQASGFISLCDCGLWGRPDTFEDGVCVECYDELFPEDDDFDDDEDDFLDDILGFEDGDLDDEDDIFDEDLSDYYFDETDEEDL